ncbi:MAG: hypothetical protein C0457_06345 [Polymorphum sp.]|uniref:hypothetical protein n=1 Tax=Pannonibacter indicus TaxID=466044 RepID=UPI001D69FA8B|nr:hypothetical protein [Polymorphum sp.]
MHDDEEKLAAAMALALAPEKRAFVSPYLSDHIGGKIAVTCPDCGLSRRYDATDLLLKTGDVCMPDLLPLVARAEGCPRPGNIRLPQCLLRYAFPVTSMSGPMPGPNG